MVLGAGTVVAINGEILEKPVDAALRDGIPRFMSRTAPEAQQQTSASTKALSTLTG